MCRGTTCFFFQAEDGIRDTSVTGVQTCALPIYSRSASAPRSGDRRARNPDRGALADRLCVMQLPWARPRPRSEERRVGKSVDTGGRRTSGKKKKKQVRV